MMDLQDIAEVWRSRVESIRDIVLARLKENVACEDVGVVVSSDGGQVIVAARGRANSAPDPRASKAGYTRLEAAATKHNAEELVSLKDRIMDPNGRSLGRGGKPGTERDQEAARMLTMVRSDLEPDLKRLAIEALLSGQE